MRGLWQRAMYAWETHLTTRDTNRIVRPLEWGMEWTRSWPQVNGNFPQNLSEFDNAAAENYFAELNRKVVSDSDRFFSYEKPTDFRLEERLPKLFPTNMRQQKQLEKLDKMARTGKLKPAKFLRFTSPVRTPYPENDTVNARWFPAFDANGRPSRKAVVVLPQWNADAFSHNALCAIMNRYGVSALRLSKPYHEIRRPQELERSDYAVSANIGRTLDSCRQGVIDIRCCLDWLELQGCERFGILGTSLGSCYAFIASAHDRRLKVNAFNHASTYFGDVVWTGQSTRHIRSGIEDVISLESLRQSWLAISPMAYFDKYARWPKKSLIVYAKYDLTFLPQFSEQVVEEFERWDLNHRVAILPCGHYTTGETPYKFMDAWHIGRF